MILEQRQIEGLRVGIVSKICTPEFRHVTDCLDTIDAQAQTIAELTKERDGYLHQLQNDEGYAELTAKLDAVRGLAPEWKEAMFTTNREYSNRAMALLSKQRADELLAILDAPTKPR